MDRTMPATSAEEGAWPLSVPAGASASWAGAPDVAAGGVLAEIGIARATNLARVGQYAAAERILGTAKVSGDYAAPVLHLRARIVAQQGRLRDAERLWREALASDPDNPAYRAALARLAAQASGSGRAVALPALAISALLGGLVIGLVQQSRDTGWQEVDERFARAQEEIATRLNGVSLSQDEMTRRVEELTERLDKMAQAQGAASAELSKRQSVLPDNIDRAAAHLPDGLIDELSLSGVRVVRQENAARLVFNRGLFASGARLRREAVPILTAIAQTLSPYADRVAVDVAGHSDNKPLISGSRYSSIEALSLARAQVVAKIIMTTGGVSPPFVRVRSAAPGENPFPNDSAQNTARNRTVVLTVISLPSRL